MPRKGLCPPFCSHCKFILEARNFTPGSRDRDQGFHNLPQIRNRKTETHHEHDNRDNTVWHRCGGSG